MTGSSMLLTIGTILDRAAEAGFKVYVTFHGSEHGVYGSIVARDEQGVAVSMEVAGEMQYLVVRLADVTSVRVPAQAVAA